MTEHAVVIAGGGPTGLMLAAELALAGVAVVERRASQDLIGSRAGALHSRTIEVLDLRGIADRFLSQGQVAQVAGFAWIPLDISDFPTRHNYGLGLWQNHIERILAGWVGELRVPIYYGSEVTGIAQDDTGVDVEVSDGRSLRAEYLVGCDGGRSLIRKTAGIEFPGWGPTTSCLIAEGELAEEPAWGLRRDALGIHSLSRMGDGGPVRRCDILSRTHKGGSGWAATCWDSRRSTRRRSRSLAARARTWGSFRGSKASACRLAIA
jgi:3-(3-hydroxy-phenyl)propionate hydroxylase